MFQYDKELEKIIKIIGEENYSGISDVDIGIIDNNVINNVGIKIMLNCPLRKIKKKAGEINRFIEDEVNKLGGTENVEYTIIFYNEFGVFDLGKAPIELNGDFMLDLNNALMCNEREMGDGRGEITIIWFSNKVQDDVNKILHTSGEER